jgi:hypothetical protein
VSTAIEKLLTYAIGREADYDDMPAVRRILGEAAGSGYRVSDFIVGIVRSVPFQMRLKESPREEPGGIASARQEN